MCPVAKVRTPRGAWVAAALRALGEGGPDAVRIETLAASLGVSKGGFYWHFADRRALLDETLDTWERASTEDVIARIEAEPADARAKVQLLFELAPSADFAVELAMRDWSRRDRAVAERLRRIDTRRLAWLRSLFVQFSAGEEEAEARTMLAYSLMIGAYFIVARPGEKPRMLQLALDRLLS